MKSEDFDLVSTLVKDRSGLVLTKEKVYLLESRLMPLARRRKLDTIDALVSAIRTRKEEALIKEVVDAMTTNESLFFRDIKPFDHLKKTALPRLMEARKGQRSIRIWSAACSSGQEPYSIAMLLKEETASFGSFRFEITATDISSEILARAKNGIYSQFEVQRGLPIQLLLKYFTQDGDKWQIKPEMRSMVQYREFNLMQHPRSLGRFDVVFCRNVLIYFDQPTKAKVLAGIAEQMHPDGVLYLGGAETVLGVSDRFEPVPGERGVYRPVQSAAAAAGRV